jgi:hypothetical protein
VSDANDLHPLIRADLELRSAAGERHRERRRQDLEAFRRLRERNPDSPELVAEPEPPDASTTLDELALALVQYAAVDVEPGLRDDVVGVRAQLAVQRERWLEISGDPATVVDLLRLLSDEQLDTLAVSLAAGSWSDEELRAAAESLVSAGPSGPQT